MMSIRRLVLPVLAAAAAVLLVTTPAAALPAFGTTPVSGGGSPDGPQVVVSAVAVGHHAAFDRVVFTFRGGVPHFDVSYVSEVTEDASGKPVPLLGSAFLLVSLRPTAWTVSPAPQGTITPGFPMLKQVKGAGDFEAVTSYGIGAASKSGFRAFALTGPDRLVIDLAIPASAGSGTGTGTGGTKAGGTGTSGGGLAQTGVSHTVPLAIGGLGLVGLGAASLWLARRRYAT
jgi:LPXTG-motif cell wall-anchored protein